MADYQHHNSEAVTRRMFRVRKAQEEEDTAGEEDVSGEAPGREMDPVFSVLIWRSCFLAASLSCTRSRGL